MGDGVALMIRSMVRLVSAVLIVGALAVAAPTAGAAMPALSCKMRAEGGSPPSRFARPSDVVVGPVAFAGLKRVADPREFATYENTRTGLFSVKAGLSVRAGRVVSISIAPEDRSAARVGFVGAPARGVPAVRASACDKNEPAFSYKGRVGITTGWAFGFVLTEARCVHVVVRERGRTQPFRRVVGFGIEGCGPAG
jgi:hypothetical protein